MRTVLTVAMVTLLVVFLYQPAHHTPARFIDTLEAEHRGNARMWGEERADRILERMGHLRAQVDSYPFPGKGKAEPKGKERSTPVNVGDVLARLANNDYVQAMEWMFSLVLYRLSSLWEITPLFVPFIFLALLDGLIERTVRSHEFRSHNPTIYGVFKGSAVVLLAALPTVFTLPYPFHPLLLAGVPIALAFCGWRIAAHFHQTV